MQFPVKQSVRNVGPPPPLSLQSLTIDAADKIQNRFANMYKFNVALYANIIALLQYNSQDLWMSMEAILEPK